MKHAHLLQHPELPKPDFTPIKRLLGDMMPDMPVGPRGRQRLIRALTQRFGENYRAFEAANEALKHFDNESAHVRAWLHAKGVQHV